MMGGGMLLTSVARAVGSTGPNATISGQIASSTSTGCSGCRGQLSRPNSGTFGSHASSLSKQQVDLMDDWQFSESDESAEGRSLERLVFGSSSSPLSPHYVEQEESEECWHIFGLPPSLEEATEAAFELESVLSSWLLTVKEQQDLSDSASCASLVLEHSSQSDVKTGGGGSDCDASEWMEPHLIVSNTGSVHVDRNPVHEAFWLLQNNPHVKGAVLSIASDPDVWHAMMKNEKVQELKRVYEESRGLASTIRDTGSAIKPLSPTPVRDQDAPSADSSSDEQDMLSSVSELLRLMLAESKQALVHVKWNIWRLVKSVFALVGNKSRRSGKQHEVDGVDDETSKDVVRSSMMLAVAVVAIVLLKRMQP